ncbi:MAG TPA: adenylate kinase [Gaiellaceae bacterium]|nr:adenylate kinase [Gaiellaceae bacterium]
MPLDLVILGPPGAGKGTQAELVAADAGIPHVATGDMLREAMAEETPLGREVKPIYDAGDLIPDELMVGLIRERLSQQDTEAGFILDGFPRTLPQAEALDEMLAEIDRTLSAVLLFDLPEEVAVERLLGRAREQGRSDDTPEVIRHRLEVFHAKTKPVVDYYRSKGLLVDIRAERAVDEVLAEVQQVLAAAGQR